MHFRTLAQEATQKNKSALDHIDRFGPDWEFWFTAGLWSALAIGLVLLFQRRIPHSYFFAFFAVGFLLSLCWREGQLAETYAVAYENSGLDPRDVVYDCLQIHQAMSNRLIGMLLILFLALAIPRRPDREKVAA